MKNIYHTLLESLSGEPALCLATLVSTRGSVPQEPGSSAIFTADGLLAGTLGGGVLEGDATERATGLLKGLETSNGRALFYEYKLDADINDEEGAICGGSAWVLLDPDPGESAGVFRQMMDSVKAGDAGILLTRISGNGSPSPVRSWHESGSLADDNGSEDWPGLDAKMEAALERGVCLSMDHPELGTLFIEPVAPLPRLIIAGAGHIGKALAHQGNILDFDVTVIDDREEHANAGNIPDADQIIVGPVGEAIRNLPKTEDTYIVIVTRGHRDDSVALRECIRSGVPYIGMIGSRKKIRLMRRKFIDEGWATAAGFDRVHAPIGMEIGSVTIQEIAISIAAQLVAVRASFRKGKKRELISSLILAAGESKRMGEPKMLLPFDGSTIIETVIGNARKSVIDRHYIVLGSGAQAIEARIQDLPVEAVHNTDFKKGMLSSVQEGLKAVTDKTTAVLIMLGDQPMISYAVICMLITTYKQSDKGILVASRNGKRGHPMIFDSKYIPEVLGFNTDQSLRDLLENHTDDIEEVESGSGVVLRDIDTKEDYREELKMI